MTEELNTKIGSIAKVNKLGVAVGGLLGLLIFLIPLFFVPFLSLTAAKSALVVAFLVIMFGLGFLMLLNQGYLDLPRHYLFYLLSALPLVYLLSAIFSESGFFMALVGYELEVYTAGAVVVGFLLASGIIMFLRRTAQVYLMLFAFLFSSGILSLYLVLRFFLGPEFLAFGIFRGLAENPVGSLSGVGTFLGVSLLISVIILGSMKLKRFLYLTLSILTGLTMLALIFLNITWLWVLIGLSVMVFAVWQFSGGISENKSFSVPALSVSVVLIALVMVFYGGFIDNIVSESGRVNFREPETLNLSSAASMTRNAFSDEPVRFLLGTGPRDLSSQWFRYGTNDRSGQQLIVSSAPSGYLTAGFLDVGAIGFIVWLALFLSLLFLLARGMFRIKDLDPSVRVLFIVLGFSAVFFFVSLVFANQPMSVFMMFFVFLALFLFVLMKGKQIKSHRVRLTGEDKKLKSISGLAFVLLAIFLFSGFVFQRVISSAFYRQAVAAVYDQGDIDRADSRLSLASQLSRQDRYHRLRSELFLLRISSEVSGIEEMDTGQLDRVSDFVQSQFRGALIQANLATNIFPDNYRNYRQAGEVYQTLIPFNFTDLDAYAEARSQYDKALDLAPNNPSLVLDLARLEFTAGNLEEARRYAERSLEMEGRFADAVFFISQIDLAEGKMEEAVDSVRQAINISPFDPGLYFQLGLLQREIGQIEQAVEAFNVSIMLAPQFSNGWYFLALSYFDVGERDRAQEILERLTERHPGNERLSQMLENVRRGLDPLRGVEELMPAGRLPVEERLPAELTEEEIDAEMEDEILDMEDEEEDEGEEEVEE